MKKTLNWNWLLRDWRYKLIAFVFASMITIFIYAEPGRIITSEIALKTSIANIQSDLVITNELPEFVQLTIQGAQGRLNTINNANGLCVLDLKSYNKPGTYSVPYRISKLSQMSIIRPPDPVIVQLEPLLVRTIEVKLMKKETVPEGIRIVKESFEPLSVRISGPQDDVSNIENVWAVIDVSQISTDIEDSLPLVPYSASLKPIESKNIIIDPPQIKVKIKVSTAGHYIRVEVLPNIKDDKNRNLNIVVKPSHVVIPRDRLKDEIPEYVLTEPIDISDVDDEYTAMIPVIYPFENKIGLKLLVQVTVSFDAQMKEKNDEKNQINWKVQFVNLGDGLQAELSPDIIRLLPQNRTLTLPKQVFIDLKNKDVGKYRLKVQIDPASEAQYWQLSEDYINVKIIRIQE